MTVKDKLPIIKDSTFPLESAESLLLSSSVILIFGRNVIKIIKKKISDQESDIEKIIYLSIYLNFFDKQ